MKNVNNLKKTIFLVVGILLIFSGNVSATWCQGEPLPEQKSFWVFETSLKYLLSNGEEYNRENEYLLTTETGYMKNISPKKSIGGTVYASAYDGGSHFGLKFRYRHWLNKNFSIDLSPGLILSASDNNMQVKMPSFIASASLGIKDLLAFDIHYQAIRYSQSGYNYIYNYGEFTQTPFSNSGTKSNWYMGVRFGSYAAVISTVVVTAVVLVALSQWNSGGSYWGSSSY